MRNGLQIAGRAFLVALACALALALAGCASMGSADAEDAQRATDNRQYMAQLNQQMSELQQIMDDFQVAVSEGNTVAMRAQEQKADAVIQAIEASEATDDLKDAKALYVDALTTLNDAMKDYAELYTQVDNNQVSSEELSERLQQVQDAYDDGVAKLQTADEAVQKLAQG